MSGKKDTVLYLCGRGFGKSHTASSIMIDEAMATPNLVIALFAADFGSLKKVNWLGDSGIIKSIHPKLLKECTFNKSDLTLTFPNGSLIISYSAESFEKSRGANAGMVVADELASWSYAQDALDACRLILRNGKNPRLLITTTPRPTDVIKTLAADDDVQLITGTTYQNYYLPDSYVNSLKKQLTERLFKQEVLASVLDDNLYALFQMNNIMDNRVIADGFDFDTIKQFCIAIDPAVSSNEDSDSTGILVAGLSYDGEYYVFEDATMKMATPESWSKKVVSLFKKYNAISAAPVSIVAEVNNGGDLISSVIKNASRREKSVVLPPVRVVRATKGKELRAEPVAALYEQDIVHHVGELLELEVQMTDWNPAQKGSKSPDRLDALVWAITSLSKGFAAPASASYGVVSKLDTINGIKPINPYCGYS